MKKLVALGAITFFFAQPLMAQNCDTYEIKLNSLVQKNSYSEAYTVLQDALANCADKKINYYNFGETVLKELIESTQDQAKKEQYANELVDLIEKRMQYFPDDKKAFWQGEIINYQLNNGLIDKKEAYKKYNALFAQSEGTQKLSANTVLTYYTAALELLQEGEIDFEQAMDMYFKTKKVAEDNIEMRSVEYGKLAEKLDSIQKINPNNKLTQLETQQMENAQENKDIFVDVNDSMESILAEYTTCENIAPMYINNFEANRDSMEWVTTSYKQLASLDCYDEPIMATLEKQYEYLWKKENPQSEQVQVASTSGPGGAYSRGATMFKKGNYSGAIEEFKKALDEASGTKKGDIAYYIALSYQKTGSLSNAVSWAKQAANYKPGYGAPYQLIASVFGSNANSCGNNTFEKLSAYWVAADFANKACAVDSRSCKWGKSAAASYNANGPSLEMAFQQGKKKGDRVSISCFGGATTTVR